MLNLLTGKYIIDDLYYLSLTLGFIYTSLTIYIIYKLTQNNLKLFTTAVLIIFSSKAVLDFSSSGLENSLSYFLIACFFYTILKLTEHKYYFLILSIILSCMFLNRMDLIIAFLPFALYSFFYKAYQDHQIKKSTIQGFIGFIPVILWSAFAVYYYGSFFANSVIAKTNTGLPTTHLQIQGFQYLYANIIYDPFTSLFIYITIIYAVFSKNSINKLLGIGLSLYLLYLINVGADYMYGRFLTVPFMISLFIFVQSIKNYKFNYNIFITIAIALSSYNLYQYTLKDTSLFNISTISFNDERAFYYRTTGLWLNITNTNTSIANHFLETPNLFKDPENHPIALYTMGFNGYIASKVRPKKHIIDGLGLTDAFLAAHPMSYGYWRIGHFKRAINQQYIDSIKNNQNLITLTEDHYVLEQVFLLTRAPLNDPKRWDAIINWHNGNTFKVAKQAFQHYPHKWLLNRNESMLKNLWFPDHQ